LEKLEMSFVGTANPHFWVNKRVLLTGHTGFKGAWLALILSRMGAKVTGISLPPSTTPNLFTLANVDQLVDSHFIDIRDAKSLFKVVSQVKPEIVLHLAAQALVRVGYKDPLTTFETNIIGTANVLDALRGIDFARVVVAITTDKVYQNLEHHYPYRETDILGGHDPYSASKTCSEIIISSYRDSYLSQQGIAVASARAGNVIGGGDWSEDRLIPDAIRAWDAGAILEIRRPNAIRPWQHVLEPLNAYMVLAERLYADSSLSGAYNFGPQTHEAATVQEVIQLANQFYGLGAVSYGDGGEGPHEAGILTLEIAKARELLGVTPRWNLQETIQHTMGWYQKHREGAKSATLCDEDIDKFNKAVSV
jgi:CDP-glucose 4,6-dehydratase